MMASLNAFITLVIVACFLVHETLSLREYYLDSDCDYRTVNVDDNGVRIHGRSRTAPSNPPTRCVIYLRSAYTKNDGTNKLQIIVDSLNIKDCLIKLDLFNGRRSAGEYLKALSCQQRPAGRIYSTTNEVTVRFTRPETLRNTEYGFSLTIKPWKDRSEQPSKTSNDKLAIGAIIGIVIGCLVVIIVVILLCWCCCTGRISGFSGTFAKSEKAPGHLNKGLTEEKYKPPAVVLNDPLLYDPNTRGLASNNYQPRYFQRGIPRNELGVGNPNRNYYNDGRQPEYDRRQGEGTGYYGNAPNQRPNNRGPVHNYEPYEIDKRNKKASPPQQRKETMIDDVFDSDSNSQTTGVDDATLQKRPHTPEKSESPKFKRKSQPVPEEEDFEKSPQLQRYKSMDLQSQPDTDTMTSPVHINAGVLASVEDDIGGSPVGSLRKNKKSPKAKRKDGRQPDSMAMPPEAFEPIFTEPISGINYPTNQYQPGYGQMAPQFPGGFMPYGLIPSGAFAPGVPGSQTYAYAYQTVPPGGVGGSPATQGAWVVQNTPTTDGNRQTAFAVQETVSPDRASTQDKRKKNSDPFGRPSNRGSGNSKRGRNHEKGYAPDLSVVTRGAAPPDPGQGHRSVALKSGTDPDTGVHTVQGVWTDTVADPTDPKPGEDNPQITRKTITRVTTKSGYGELPPENDPLIALDDEPAFLAPSSRPTQAYTPSIMPPNPSNTGNIDFYTGAGSTIPPPERSSTPTSIRLAPITYNGVIRDRIPIDDSTV